MEWKFVTGDSGTLTLKEWESVGSVIHEISTKFKVVAINFETGKTGETVIEIEVREEDVV